MRDNYIYLIMAHMIQVMTVRSQITSEITSGDILIIDTRKL